MPELPRNCTAGTILSLLRSLAMTRPESPQILPRMRGFAARCRAGIPDPPSPLRHAANAESTAKPHPEIGMRADRPVPAMPASAASVFIKAPGTRSEFIDGKRKRRASFSISLHSAHRRLRRLIQRKSKIQRLLLPEPRRPPSDKATRAAKPESIRAHRRRKSSSFQGCVRVRCRKIPFT